MQLIFSWPSIWRGIAHIYTYVDCTSFVQTVFCVFFCIHLETNGMWITIQRMTATVTTNGWTKRRDFAWCKFCTLFSSPVHPARHRTIPKSIAFVYSIALRSTIISRRTPTSPLQSHVAMIISYLRPATKRIIKKTWHNCSDKKWLIQKLKKN